MDPSRYNRAPVPRHDREVPEPLDEVDAKWKWVNRIRRIVRWPWILLMIPIWGGFLFLLTNWEKEEERDRYKKDIRSLWQD